MRYKNSHNEMRYMSNLPQQHKYSADLNLQQFNTRRHLKSQPMFKKRYLMSNLLKRIIRRYLNSLQQQQ